MNRRKLAQLVFEILKRKNMKYSEKKLWRFIAEMDDDSLLEEYVSLVKGEEDGNENNA